MSDDWILKERKLSLEEEKERTRERRYRREQITTRIIGVAISIGVVLVIGALIFALYKGWESGQQREQQATLACIEKGGLAITIGGNGGQRVCLIDKEVTE